MGTYRDMATILYRLLFPISLNGANNTRSGVSRVPGTDVDSVVSILSYPIVLLVTFSPFISRSQSSSCEDITKFLSYKGQHTTTLTTGYQRLDQEVVDITQGTGLIKHVAKTAPLTQESVSDCKRRLFYSRVSPAKQERVTGYRQPAAPGTDPGTAEVALVTNACKTKMESAKVTGVTKGSLANGVDTNKAKPLGLKGRKAASFLCTGSTDSCRYGKSNFFNYEQFGGGDDFCGSAVASHNDNVEGSGDGNHGVEDGEDGGGDSGGGGSGGGGSGGSGNGDYRCRDGEYGGIEHSHDQFDHDNCVSQGSFDCNYSGFSTSYSSSSEVRVKVDMSFSAKDIENDWSDMVHGPCDSVKDVYYLSNLHHQHSFPQDQGRTDQLETLGRKKRRKCHRRKKYTNSKQSVNGNESGCGINHAERDNDCKWARYRDKGFDSSAISKVDGESLQSLLRTTSCAKAVRARTNMSNYSLGAPTDELRGLMNQLQQESDLRASVPPHESQTLFDTAYFMECLNARNEQKRSPKPFTTTAKNKREDTRSSRVSDSKQRGLSRIRNELVKEKTMVEKSGRLSKISQRKESFSSGVSITLLNKIVSVNDSRGYPNRETGARCVQDEIIQHKGSCQNTQISRHTRIANQSSPLVRSHTYPYASLGTKFGGKHHNKVNTRIKQDVAMQTDTVAMWLKKQRHKNKILPRLAGSLLRSQGQPANSRSPSQKFRDTSKFQLGFEECSKFGQVFKHRAIILQGLGNSSKLAQGFDDKPSNDIALEAPIQNEHYESKDPIYDGEESKSSQYSSLGCIVHLGSLSNLKPAASGRVKDQDKALQPIEGYILNSKTPIANTRLLCGRSGRSTTYENWSSSEAVYGPGTVTACTERSSAKKFPSLSSYLDHLEQKTAVKFQSARNSYDQKQPKRKQKSPLFHLSNILEECDLLKATSASKSSVGQQNLSTDKVAQSTRLSNHHHRNQMDGTNDNAQVTQDKCPLKVNTAEVEDKASQSNQPAKDTKTATTTKLVAPPPKQNAKLKDRNVSTEKNLAEAEKCYTKAPVSSWRRRFAYMHFRRTAKPKPGGKDITEHKKDQNTKFRLTGVENITFTQQQSEDEIRKRITQSNKGESCKSETEIGTCNKQTSRDETEKTLKKAKGEEVKPCIKQTIRNRHEKLKEDQKCAKNRESEERDKKCVKNQVSEEEDKKCAKDRVSDEENKKCFKNQLTEEEDKKCVKQRSGDKYEKLKKKTSEKSKEKFIKQLRRNKNDIYINQKKRNESERLIKQMSEDENEMCQNVNNVKESGELERNKPPIAIPGLAELVGEYKSSLESDVPGAEGGEPEDKEGIKPVVTNLRKHVIPALLQAKTHKGRNSPQLSCSLSPLAKGDNRSVDETSTSLDIQSLFEVAKAVLKKAKKESVKSKQKETPKSVPQTHPAEETTEIPPSDDPELKYTLKAQNVYGIESDVTRANTSGDPSFTHFYKVNESKGIKPWRTTKAFTNRLNLILQRNKGNTISHRVQRFSRTRKEPTNRKIYVVHKPTHTSMSQLSHKMDAENKPKVMKSKLFFKPKTCTAHTQLQVLGAPMGTTATKSIDSTQTRSNKQFSGGPPKLRTEALAKRRHERATQPQTVCVGTDKVEKRKKKMRKGSLFKLSGIHLLQDLKEVNEGFEDTSSVVMCQHGLGDQNMVPGTTSMYQLGMEELQVSSVKSRKTSPTSIISSPRRRAQVLGIDPAQAAAVYLASLNTGVGSQVTVNASTRVDKVESDFLSWLEKMNAHCESDPTTGADGADNDQRYLKNLINDTTPVEDTKLSCMLEPITGFQQDDLPHETTPVPVESKSSKCQQKPDECQHTTPKPSDTLLTNTEPEPSMSVKVIKSLLQSACSRFHSLPNIASRQRAAEANMRTSASENTHSSISAFQLPLLDEENISLNMETLTRSTTWKNVCKRPKQTPQRTKLDTTVVSHRVDNTVSSNTNTQGATGDIPQTAGGLQVNKTSLEDLHKTLHSSISVKNVKLEGENYSVVRMSSSSNNETGDSNDCLEKQSQGVDKQVSSNNESGDSNDCLEKQSQGGDKQGINKEKRTVDGKLSRAEAIRESNKISKLPSRKRSGSEVNEENNKALYRPKRSKRKEKSTQSAEQEHILDVKKAKSTADLRVDSPVSADNQPNQHEREGGERKVKSLIVCQDYNIAQSVGTLTSSVSAHHVPDYRCNPQQFDPKLSQPCSDSISKVNPSSEDGSSRAAVFITNSLVDHGHKSSEVSQSARERGLSSTSGYATIDAESSVAACHRARVLANTISTFSSLVMKLAHDTNCDDEMVSAQARAVCKALHSETNKEVVVREVLSPITEEGDYSEYGRGNVSEGYIHDNPLPRGEQGTDYSQIITGLRDASFERLGDKKSAQRDVVGSMNDARNRHQQAADTTVDCVLRQYPGHMIEKTRDVGGHLDDIPITVVYTNPNSEVFDLSFLNEDSVSAESWTQNTIPSQVRRCDSTDGLEDNTPKLPAGLILIQPGNTAEICEEETVSFEDTNTSNGECRLLKGNKDEPKQVSTMQDSVREESNLAADFCDNKHIKQNNKFQDLESLLDLALEKSSTQNSNSESPFVFTVMGDRRGKEKRASRRVLSSKNDSARKIDELLQGGREIGSHKLVVSESPGCHRGDAQPLRSASGDDMRLEHFLRRDDRPSAPNIKGDVYNKFSNTASLPSSPGQPQKSAIMKTSEVGLKEATADTARDSIKSQFKNVKISEDCVHHSCQPANIMWKQREVLDELKQLSRPVEEVAGDRSIVCSPNRLPTLRCSSRWMASENRSFREGKGDSKQSLASEVQGTGGFPSLERMSPNKDLYCQKAPESSIDVRVSFEDSATDTKRLKTHKLLNEQISTIKQVEYVKSREASGGSDDLGAPPVMPVLPYQATLEDDGKKSQSASSSSSIVLSWVGSNHVLEDNQADYFSLSQSIKQEVSQEEKLCGRLIYQQVGSLERPSWAEDPQSQDAKSAESTQYQSTRCRNRHATLNQPSSINKFHVANKPENQQKRKNCNENKANSEVECDTSIHISLPYWSEVPEHSNVDSVRSSLCVVGVGNSDDEITDSVVSASGILEQQSYLHHVMQNFVGDLEMPVSHVEKAQTASTGRALTDQCGDKGGYVFSAWATQKLNSEHAQPVKRPCSALTYKNTMSSTSRNKVGSFYNDRKFNNDKTRLPKPNQVNNRGCTVSKHVIHSMECHNPTRSYGKTDRHKTGEEYAENDKYTSPAISLEDHLRKRCRAKKSGFMACGANSEAGVNEVSERPYISLTEHLRVRPAWSWHRVPADNVVETNAMAVSSQHSLNWYRPQSLSSSNSLGNPPVMQPSPSHCSQPEKDSTVEQANGAPCGGPECGDIVRSHRQKRQDGQVVREFPSTLVDTDICRDLRHQAASDLSRAGPRTRNTTVVGRIEQSKRTRDTTVVGHLHPKTRIRDATAFRPLERTTQQADSYKVSKIVEMFEKKTLKKPSR